MHIVRHPLAKRDLLALVAHILETTQGNIAAASQRHDEIDALLADTAANRHSGIRLSPPLEGWLVRHGGRGHRITIVLNAITSQNALHVALVAFWGAGLDYEGQGRKGFVDHP